MIVHKSIALVLSLCLSMAVVCSVSSFAEYFPLRNPSEEAIRELYQSLWAWSNCAQCGNNGNCSSYQCPWTLRNLLDSYQEFYRKITFRYTSEDWSNPRPAFQSHGDLHRLIQFVVERPHIARNLLMSEFFSGDGIANLTSSDKDRAFNLAYSAIAMMSCATRNPYQIQCAMNRPVVWSSTQSAQEVFATAIPIGQPLTQEEVCYVTDNVSAHRLQDAGISLSNTNDPRKHLYLDQTAKRLYVFHQIGFLKGHLLFQVRNGAVAQ